MTCKIKPSFAFLVVTYNHQDYILEHLESIKYLVNTHALGIAVDLIVNDDCSKDQTRTLVDFWLKSNEHIFRQVTTLYNQKNLGTCSSLNNMLSHVVADRCKHTAGDDVYSFENIFELTQHDSQVAMVSGRPLYLVDGDLGLNVTSNTMVTATQLIYQNDSLLHRFKHWSYNNAPNILYATDCLLNTKVRAYLQRFDVVDDWPLQLSIAREFPKRRFELVDRVLVYYRRTSGSTFIVENSRFMTDKNNLYSDLIKNENNFIEKTRLKSRKFCFNLKLKFIIKIINLDAYFFALSFLWCYISIRQINKEVDLNLNAHLEHYAKIKIIAKDSHSKLID